MDQTATEKTTIHRLSVLAPPGSADGLVLRRRCDSALGLVDLRPAGLAPGAILHVRRVRAAAPGGAGRTAGIAEALAWGGAVNQALERLARSAARPALGAPPADAEAVLFAGPDEQLACLARDWLDGLLPARWWWQALLEDAGGQARAAVLRAWLGSNPAVPGALDLLARRQSAERFAARLAPDEARAALAGLVAWFGLDTRLAPASPARSFPVEGLVLHLPGSGTASGRLPGQARAERAGAYGRADLAPPWQSIAPEAAGQALSQEQAELLGVGLALVRTPAEVRAPRFIQRVLAWRARPADRPSAAAGGTPEQPGLVRSPGGVRAAVKAGPGQAVQVNHPGAVETGRPAAELPAPRSEPRAPVNRGEAAGAPLVQAPWPAGEPQDEPQAELCATRFGGLFFLTNLAIGLGLFNDFTRPAEPGLPLSLWAFLRLVGRALLGPSLEQDPLWPFLERLSGGFSPLPAGTLPDEWRMAPAWLEPFGAAGPWRWKARGGRLLVTHPAGFLVLDVPRRGALARQLARELAPYGEEKGPARLLASAAGWRGSVSQRTATPNRQRLRPPFSPLTSPHPARRWSGWLVPYLRAYLALALPAGRDPAGRLARLDARVRLTTTHLDVYFDLNDLPIEIRLAGLDRNPWWVPAAGRYIAFHFDV